MKRFTANPRYQVTTSYFFFASTWILATDIIVEWGSWSTLREQSTKGLFFIAVTTALLNWLLKRHYGINIRANQERDDALTAYTTLFEQHGLPQLLIDPANGQIMKANEAASAYYGWTVPQLCTMTIAAINTLTEAEIFAEMANARLQRRNYFKFCHRLSSGELRQVEVFSHPVQLHGRSLLYSIVVDISQQHNGQLALERSNRLLKAFVSSARAIMLHSNKQDIADAITRALVKKGQYAMAWIGLVPDRASEPIQVFSHWGDTHHYLDAVTLTADNSETGNGPTGRAIKSGRPQWVSDIQTDPSYRVWREAALTSNFRSAASLPLLQKGQVFGVLVLYSHHADGFDADEIGYLEALATDLSHALISVDSVREYDRVNTERLVAISRSREALFETVAVLSETVEIRDPYTAGHQRRVAWLAIAIGRELGLSKEQLEPLNVAALLHDIGKIAVPAELLAKPGKLSPAEFELIKQHPQVGEDLLKKISFAAPIARIVGQHHERLDGTGYPLGITGEDILLEARIIGVADVVEAMISHRPYRAGLPLETACAEIKAGRGSKYDSAVVDACLKVMREGGYEALGPSGDVLDRATISVSVG